MAGDLGVLVERGREDRFVAGDREHPDTGLLGGLLRLQAAAGVIEVERDVAGVRDRPLRNVAFGVGTQVVTSLDADVRNFVEPVVLALEEVVEEPALYVQRFGAVEHLPGLAAVRVQPLVGRSQL